MNLIEYLIVLTLLSLAIPVIIAYCGEEIKRARKNKKKKGGD